MIWLLLHRVRDTEENGAIKKVAVTFFLPYKLPGRLVKCPYYKPDPANPAIFPLHAKGDPKPAQATSRGGFEVDCEEKETANQPAVPNIPSAGQGAPQGQKEIEKAIGDYLKARREKERESAR